MLTLKLNDMNYKVNAKTLPWKGKVKLHNNKATYESKEFVSAEGEVYTKDIITFSVVCNKHSPEEGRTYSVYALVTENWDTSEQLLTVQGYYC